MTDKSHVICMTFFSSDEDVPEVLGAGEGERESLIEGKGEDNTIIGREGNFLAVVIFVNVKQPDPSKRLPR